MYGSGMVPNREALLKELDVLSAPHRTRRMALLGRDTQGSQELRALLNELQSDTYEASLALDAAGAARDEHVILEALRHESVLVRCKAADLACRYCSDDAVTTEISGAAPAIRRRLLKGISKERRAVLATALLEEVAARWGAREACLLLSACSAEVVRQHLPMLGVAVLRWRPICLSHPDAVLEYLRQTFAEAPDRDRCDLWQRFREPLRILGRIRPSEVLEFAIEEAPKEDFPEVLERHLGQWIRLANARVFALLTRGGRRGRLVQRGLPRGALRALSHFSAEQRFDLARILAENPPRLAAMLRRLPPLLRGEVFLKAYDHHETPGSTSCPPLLEVLPHALRDREAARLLDLRAIRADPKAILEVTALRDIRLARPVLELAATSALPAERARALSLLILCTGRYRRGMTETLHCLARIKDEHDAVRLAVFRALATVSPSAFRDAHATALTGLVDFLVEAADISPETRAAAQDLAVQMLRVGTSRPANALFQFGITTLAKLARRTGVIPLPSLTQNLRRGVEHRIFAAMLPVIQAMEPPDHDELVLALAQALGKRAHPLDPLQALLEELTLAPSAAVAQQAIELWLSPPKTRDARVMKLLRHDASMIVLPMVFEHLHRFRQAWLDPYLDGQPIKGRYATGQTVYLLPPASGFHRWLPRQQQALQQLFESVATDTSRSDWERTASVRTISRMPAISIDELHLYLNAEEAAIARAAIGSLAWSDRPHQALPLLFDLARGGEGSAAMWALRQAAEYIEAEPLHTVLSSLLATPLDVSVHEKVARLLGAFPSDVTLALLVDEWAKADLPRDVRVAIGRSARRLLDVEEGWWLLEELAGSADGGVAASLLEQSAAELRPDHRARYGDLLLRLTAHPDVRVARRAFVGLVVWSSGSEERFARAAAAHILDLDRGGAWTGAIDLLVASCRDGRAKDTLSDVVRELTSSLGADTTNSTTERDVPARQRLWRLCTRLIALPGANRVARRSTFETLYTILLHDPTLWPVAAHLRIAAIEWNEPARAANALLAMVRLAPQLGLSDFLSAIEATLADSTTSCGPEALLATVDHLIEGLAVGSMPPSRAPRSWSSSPAAAISERGAALSQSSPPRRSMSPTQPLTAPSSPRLAIDPWLTEPPPSSSPLDSSATPLAALILLASAGRRLAWREDCATRLRRLRQHDLLDVRKEALRTWTAAEES